MTSMQKQWAIDITAGVTIAALLCAVLVFSSGSSEVFIYNNF